jgi:hypothetical protein
MGVPSNINRGVSSRQLSEREKSSATEKSSRYVRPLNPSKTLYRVPISISVFLPRESRGIHIPVIAASCFPSFESPAHQNDGDYARGNSSLPRHFSHYSNQRLRAGSVA